jgi:hypothetical protein
VRSDLFISEPLQSKHAVNVATFFVVKNCKLLENVTTNSTDITDIVNVTIRYSLTNDSGVTNFLELRKQGL